MSHGQEFFKLRNHCLILSKEVFFKSYSKIDGGLWDMSKIISYHNAQLNVRTAIAEWEDTICFNSHVYELQQVFYKKKKKLM